MSEPPALAGGFRWRLAYPAARYRANQSHTVPICVGIDKLIKANDDIEAFALLAWSLLE
jgi:hypothetical protein